jgi:ABC-type transport system involved in multi-copper enzyme maturation permease subunit
MSEATRGVMAVARLEFQQALWSVRSLALGALFLLFVAAGAFLGVGAVVGAPGAVPVSAAAGLVILAIVIMTAFFAPFIAMFSTVDAIVGERSARTLDMLLSRPVTRRGLALGKLLGRAAHLALIAYVAMFVGLLIIASQASPPAQDAFVLAVLVALLCTVWVSLALLVSALARTPTSALVAGVAVWLMFYVFWGFVKGGLDRIGMGGLAALLNPNTLFLGAVQANVPSLVNLGQLTAGLNTDYALPALVVFLLGAAFAAVEVFGRQDEAGV